MMRCPTVGVITFALALALSACGSDGDGADREASGSGDGGGGRQNSGLPFGELPRISQNSTFQREYKQRPKIVAFGNSFGVLAGHTLQIIRAATGDVVAEHKIPARGARIKAMGDSGHIAVWGEERQSGSELHRGEVETVTRIFDESGNKTWEGVGDAWRPVGNWLTKEADVSTGRGVDLRTPEGEDLGRLAPPSDGPFTLKDFSLVGHVNRTLIVQEMREGGLFGYSIDNVDDEKWSLQDANEGEYYLEHDPIYVGRVGQYFLVQWSPETHERKDTRGVLTLHSAEDGEHVWANTQRLGAPSLGGENYVTATDSKSSMLTFYSSGNKMTRALRVNDGKVTWEVSGWNRLHLWPSFMRGRFLYGVRFAERNWDEESGESPSGHGVAIDVVNSKVAWQNNAIVPEGMTDDGYVWLSRQSSPPIGVIAKSA